MLTLTAAYVTEFFGKRMEVNNTPFLLRKCCKLMHNIMFILAHLFIRENDR